MSVDKDYIVRELAKLYPSFPESNHKAYAIGVDHATRKLTVDDAFLRYAYKGERGALAYLQGYADGTGEDATEEPWFHLIHDWEISYGWWDR